jgi:hypothetical protein
MEGHGNSSSTCLPGQKVSIEPAWIFPNRCAPNLYRDDVTGRHLEVSAVCPYDGPEGLGTEYPSGHELFVVPDDYLVAGNEICTQLQIPPSRAGGV